VPIPWSGDAPPYGFSTGTPWLPQPTDWAGLTAAAQEADPGSTLSLYRRALRIRRESPVMGDGELIWRESGNDAVLAIERPGDGAVLVLLNVSDSETLVELDGEVLLSTGVTEYDDGGALVLAPDSCTWLALT
jgi:alpha-glucosidase